MQEPSSTNQPSTGSRGPERKSPVTIPGIIRDFLERATIGAAGTRDGDRVPHLHKLSGWQVEPEGHAMTCLIPAAFSAHLLRSLEDNGQLAVTIEEIGPHETYQFKGRYTKTRACEEEDLRLFRRQQERFGKVVSSKFGFDEQFCRTFFQKPSLAVTFEIHEIFLQTPGPGAGRRLAPPPEER